MKITTLEKLIKYTDIPYTELLKRAEKGGLLVGEGKNETIFVQDELNKSIILYPYNINNIDEGMASIEYNYSK